MFSARSPRSHRARTSGSVAHFRPSVAAGAPWRSPRSARCTGIWFRARPPISLLLLGHGLSLLAEDAGWNLARVEVGLAHRQLELAQQCPALRLEIARVFGYAPRVRLLEQRLEARKQDPRARPAARAVDSRHGLERFRGRESSRARQRGVEEQALDHVLRRHTA